ncbi:hypothetical protein [Dyadobacter sp. CY343]|uniref:hypothetical protein n=1 Tax=Dyadobacter sp. CY343 TaxID=2907299 RepID=UPI001F1B22A7|nr:hypothetical protein [Dyadobacter sp. CY343]MCE7059679.1 hypothetical protein [Dyadobacter sp. CY343]
MNSSEQRDFEHITPTEEEVNETIRQIQARLADVGSGSSADEPLSQGYRLALQILTERSEDYTDIPLEASSEKAKAITVLAINYLKGESSRQVLLDIFSD